MGKPIRHIKKPDRVRLLARGRGDGHGYTDKAKYALEDEPEAVDVEFQKELSDGAWGNMLMAKAQREEEELEALLAQLSSNIARMRDLGRRSGVDVSRDLFVVEQRYEKVRAKLADAHMGTAA